MKTIAFHANQLCLRGTEIALYTYAHYNETILGNKSYIFSSPGANMDALDKFKARFEVTLSGFYGCKHVNADYLYVIKGGGNDGIWMHEPPTLVHAVFPSKEHHGHRYAYVSDWLCKHMGYPIETHSVPHIVEPLPKPTYLLREKLGIPQNKTVFGCYGGSTEFNISWVQEAIIKTAFLRDDIVFLFMNINDFRVNYNHMQENTNNTKNNIIFLPGTWKLEEKSAFVYSCDAMIHARSGGETFGLAVSEFATANKPVLTYGESGERSHIELLGERGIYYRNYNEVYDMLNNLNKYIKYDDYYKSYDCCKPEIIMEKFKKVFLN